MPRRQPAVDVQPKRDNYRALHPTGGLASPNGPDLTALFPDLTPVLAAPLAPDLALHGPRTWVLSGKESTQPRAEPRGSRLGQQ
jgi:hypothetical protein